MGSIRIPYRRFELGECDAGQMWEVTAAPGVVVLLLDDPNFLRFSEGLRFTVEAGGLLTSAERRFVLPRAGRWYVVAHTWGVETGAHVAVASAP